MIQSLTTGSNPNTAVSNAMTAARMASENRWKRNQAIPPPPLPSRPPSSRCTRAAAGTRPLATGRKKTVDSEAAKCTIGALLPDQVSDGSSSAGVTTANHSIDAMRYNYANPNAASQHRAANAISGQMPQWTHIRGVPVKPVNKNVPTMDHVSLAEIAAAEADPSNRSGATSANHAAALARYGLDHPNTQREANKSRFEKTSEGVPPNLKIPYKRGRTLRVPEVRKQNQQEQKERQKVDPRVEYYAGTDRPAGLSPREAHVGRFHRDVHDGEKMPPYNPEGDHNRDVSTISQNAPDFMHIPGIPTVKAVYRKGVGGAEVVQHSSNAGSAWLRFNHDEPNNREQHRYDITVTSAAAPQWMHSPQHKDMGVRPKPWRKPEPQTVIHNIQMKNGRSNPGEKGHNYHYLRPPHKQRIAYHSRRHTMSARDKGKGTFRHVPHPSAISALGPEFLRIKGIPLTKFEGSNAHSASQGNQMRGLRPQTADSPRSADQLDPKGRAARNGAVSYEAPPFMKIPGIAVVHAPVENIEKIVVGEDRKPIMSANDQSRVKRKLTTGKRVRINPQFNQSSVLGRNPCKPDGSPLRVSDPTPAQKAAAAREAKADQILVPTRPSTVGSRGKDGRNGVFLGSRKSRSRRAQQSELTVPYATNYPSNPYAPLSFWERIRMRKAKKSSRTDTCSKIALESNNAVSKPEKAPPRQEAAASKSDSVVRAAEQV